MTNCFFCDELLDNGEKYYTLEVCKSCFSNLKINKLANKKPQEDKFLKSMVKKEEDIYVDALNLYATMFPKSLSHDLMGIALVSAGNDESDEVFENSMIIAARSILLFGKGRRNPQNIESSEIHALHALGNLIGIAIIGNLTSKYTKKDLENDEKMTELCDEIDNSIIEILNDIKAHDDGSLKDYVPAMNDLIKNRD
ncbi:MAG: hypothetical protein O8C61_07455 [Candidatus Methanoperedens sp.]|nr:hypothetical protein [Candidatus Methanoperedens sp.]